MPAPIDFLLKPWPNLAIHAGIFVITIIIIWSWFSEIPWVAIFAFSTFTLFNLLLAIRNRMIHGSSSNTEEGETEEGETEEGETEGGYEVSGGSTIKNLQVTQSATPQTTYTHDPNDEQGAKRDVKHGGSPTGRTQPMGTTYQETPKNKSPEIANAAELAKQQADIKARIGPAAQQANDMSDMGPDVNFSPDNY